MENNQKTPFLRRIRSFVRRDGRMTEAQSFAIKHYLPLYGLPLNHHSLDFDAVFQREARRIVEIGFGSGVSLLATAALHPDDDFIGIETHQPGVGTLLHHIHAQQLKNLKVYYADAVEVLKQCIPDDSLDAVQLFFPDPWQKRKHHKRRIIQPEFVALIATKLKRGGELHLATDWEDYAVHMMKVLSAADAFENVAGAEHFATRSIQRPVITKFEQRGEDAGRPIWELLFRRKC